MGSPSQVSDGHGSTCMNAKSPFLDPIRWVAPEMLMDSNRPTNATDVYAFAICCVEILGMGDLPWATLDDRAIHGLVIGEYSRC